ncbi:MAG: dockerin type I repeat-containing protein [Clostridia bacterium]|nr:dockerin type I repeat-containing protein [Clostridia bacterium]
MKRVISILLAVIMLAGVIIVPGVTASAADIKTGTLVTFGSYPQTRVIDPSLLASLNFLPLNWTYYDYYCDGKQENYMKYADVTLSGERYRAVTFIHYRPSGLVYSNHAFYTFQDENGYEPDNVYWFKYDPIVWRVLDADKGLLMAENLIDSQPFNKVYYENNGYYLYGDPSYTHYVSNWAYSSLRSWLNGDFYDTAFSAEKSYIKTTSLNTPSSNSSEYDADPTKDKVFLLSIADVSDPSYGFSSGSSSGADTNRVAYGTDYARCQGLYVDSSTGVYYSGASWWRLRTPYIDHYTDYVHVVGYVVNYSSTTDTGGGIRPALNVNLQSALSQSLIKITGSNNLVINGPAGAEYHNDASDIKTCTLVTFGSYPQTSVIDPSLLARLNSLSLNWTYYDYYCDGKQENYMKYADVTYSSERYRAVTFTHYRPSRLLKTSDAENTFQDENGYEPNKVYWFRYDPILWRVLDAKEGLLLAENLIDSQPFHNVDYENNSYWYGDQSCTHYASDWAYSSLRSWMNGDFYETAFSAEKSYIKTTSLTTPSSNSSKYDADPTKDKLFLLSRADVLNPSYGFSTSTDSGADTNRIAYGTDYARCQGLFVNSSIDFYYSGASYWRLRTPYYNSITDDVDYDGQVYGILYTSHTWLGVRPALNVNLQSAISQSLIKITDGNNLVINGPAGTAIPETGKTYAPGDVDGNGQILADDARLALRFSAKLEDLNETQQKAANVDGNGQVLADDARQILRFSAKLQQAFDKAV